MLDVVIVGDDPTLHGGFATVGRQIARSLHTHDLRVRYVARSAGDPGAPSDPYEVVAVDDGRADEGAEGRSDLARTIEGAVADGPRHQRVALVSVGGMRDHAEVLAAVREIGHPRPAPVIVYLPVDAAPLPPTATSTLDQADLVVPYTTFGAHTARRAGVTADIAEPIPHGVDTDVFRPLDPDERRAVRRTRFGLAEHDFLVGFFGRNCGHKRPDLALRIFAAWINGGVVRCPGCAATVALPLDPVAGEYPALRLCPHCGLRGPFERVPSPSGVCLYLHTELLTVRQRRISGGWDLERIARRLGVHERVRFEPALRFGDGVPADELSRRMAACDAHLLPYEAGAWELTVLETAACGVPNVITDAAAPPEYAAPFSVLVPPVMRTYGPRGARAFIDVGQAVDALQRLLDDPGERRRLSERAVAVARAHRWNRVGKDWAELLRRGVGGTVGAKSTKPGAVGAHRESRW